MNEWEELKKEYREIRIPKQGPGQVLEAMTRAKRQRRWESWRQVSRYVAAVFLVVLLPGALFLSRGFATGGDDCSASVEADGWFGSEESVKENGSGGFWMNKSDAEAPESVANGMADKKAEDFVADKAPSSWGGTSPDAGNTLPWEYKEAINEEILRQMVEKNQGSDDCYYIKSEKYPEGFESITEHQEYYWNGDGLLVIVFEAGTVAPVSMGTVEFIIPATVLSP